MRITAVDFFECSKNFDRERREINAKAAKEVKRNESKSGFFFFEFFAYFALILRLSRSNVFVI
jgi:hypothetical protein